jgi:hypothetical protein
MKPLGGTEKYRKTDQGSFETVHNAQHERAEERNKKVQILKWIS